MIMHHRIHQNLCNTTQLRQSPYSPDVAPCDFFVFSRPKIPHKEYRFDEIEMIQRNVTTDGTENYAKNCLPELLQGLQGPRRVLLTRMGITSKDATN